MLKPLQYCGVLGCAEKVKSGYCARHNVQRDHARPNFSIRKWYDQVHWQHLRTDVLIAAAFQCANCGTVSPDLEVDHIVKHDGDPARFFDRANLAALCKPCHTRKTNRGE